jgi:RimJ/RimL family protein N-acetyltransferase
MANLVLRPALLEDAEMASNVMTSAYPELPEDPILTRYSWEHPREGWPAARVIAELDGEPVAFVGWTHGPWEHLPERNCYVEVWLDQSKLEPALLDFLWGWVTNDAQAEGGRLLEAQVVEDEHEMVEALRRLGYQRDRTERVWELDLPKHGHRLLTEAKAARAGAEAAGIEIVTLADWQDPNALRKLHSLAELTRRDIPTTTPVIPQSYENFVERTDSPDRLRDRLWIGLVAGDPVALSFLRFPPVRGQVWTGYTCTHPVYRGRGLARAVKLQTLAQAVELGIPAVLTDNDSENAPMLHINEALGYDERRGFISFLKRVRTV